MIQQQQFLTFEHPLNERFRTFLRTEFLFNQAKYRYNNLTAPWDSRDCVSTVIELYNLIERTEFRNELLKEIERNLNSLQKLAATPAVDHRALDMVIGELETCSEVIKNYSTRQGFFPKDSDLLNSIRQRLTIPGGTCSFDLPAFHYWLNLPPKLRQHYVSQWIEVFEPLDKSLSLILDLTRQSSLPSRELAAGGTFQKTLPTHSTCQLLRIVVRNDVGVYPEISANKHRVNIRFLMANFDQSKTLQDTKDISFELTCCMI